MADTRVNVARALLGGCVSPDARSEGGRTPLRSVGADWAEPMAGMLLRAGADVNARDNEDGVYSTMSWIGRATTRGGVYSPLK